MRWLTAHPTVQIAANATVAEAGHLMEHTSASALLVGAGREAIVTASDVSRALGSGYPVDGSVSRIATKNPFVVPGTMRVVDAAALMLERDLRHLVVDLPNGGQGLVSMRAVTEVLLSSSDERTDGQDLSGSAQSSQAAFDHLDEMASDETSQRSSRLSGSARPISRTLNSEECWSLLGAGNVGRLGVVVIGRPHILPVNYVVVDDGVVFRTAEGTMLDAAEGAPLVFEVDRINPTTRSGWSVCVHGSCMPVGLGHSRQAPPVDTWAPRHRNKVFRIGADEITGRRLYGAPSQSAPMGVFDPTMSPRRVPADPHLASG